MIAALFVENGGPYYGLPDVDPWDIERDARKYDGPWTVVAHPPCSRWCQLAHINQRRYGLRVGDDGGCFDAALAAVRKWGGVLEHPAFSYAWPAFGLPMPERRGWMRTLFDPGWVCQVSQAAYGHQARKLTWLYCISPNRPRMDWRRPAASVSDMGRNRLVVSAQVSFCGNHGNSRLPRLSKRAAARTPIAFRDVLIEIARGAK